MTSRARVGAPGDRQAGQQRQADRRRRRQVADVPDEGDRPPLLARGGQRREHVGDRGEQDDRAEHPQQRLAPAPQGVDPGADDRRQDQRPEEAERVVEPGEEPVRPDVDVGPVVEDREARAQLEGALRGRQPERPELACRGSGCRPRPGCARTSSRRRANAGSPNQSAVRSRRPPPGDHDQPDQQRDHRGQEGELRPRRQAGGEARHRERRERDATPRVAVADRGPGVDEHRDAAEDAGDADDVVERLAGLELDQVLGAEGDRAADQALRPDPVGPADAVGGQQPERQPAEVDQRREDVAVEGEQRDRVHDLGVRRVERGEEDRVEVVDRAEVRRRRRTAPRAACGTRACRRGPCPRRACRASAPSRRPRPRRRLRPRSRRRSATRAAPEAPAADPRPA